MNTAVNISTRSITEWTTPLKFYGVADRRNNISNHFSLFSVFFIKHRQRRLIFYTSIRLRRINLPVTAQTAERIAAQPHILGQLRKKSAPTAQNQASRR